MNIYTKSAREGMDICVTCSSVCKEVQLELLAEDTTTVLTRLLHDFDLDSCLKILRPGKKLSLCETCHEILKNASLFRNKALKILRELEKEWCQNQLQQNTQSASAVGNTLTNETIDIKDEIDPYQAEELNPPGVLQSAFFSHKTTESYDLPSFDDANIRNEYDSDGYALPEFHSLSSENKIVRKEENIETHLLDCEERSGSALIVLNEALPEREGREPVPAPPLAPQEPRRRQRGHQHRRGRKYQMYRRFGSRDARSRSGSPGPRTGDRRSQVHDQDRSRSRSPLSCSSRGRSEPAGRGGRGSASGWGRGSASGCGRGLSIGGDRGLSSAGERGRGARGHAGHGGRQHHHRGGRGSAQAQPPQFVHPFNCVTYIRSVVVNHYY